MHYAIKDNPLIDTAVLIIDPQITQDAITQLYNTAYELYVPQCIQAPGDYFFPLLKTANKELYKAVNSPSLTPEALLKTRTQRTPLDSAASQIKIKKLTDEN